MYIFLVMDLDSWSHIDNKSADKLLVKMLQSGMAGGLETLCGQAFGAEQFHKLGTYTYTAIISLTLICLPVCVLWNFMDKFLSLVGQDPLISTGVRCFSMWLIPALFASAILKPLTRYCQTQSSIVPMLLTTVVVLAFHIATCWILIYKLEIGKNGAAIAISLSTWLNVVLLGFYVMCSSVFEKTRIAFSKEAFLSVGEFYRYAVPSAVMVCLKWWSCELLILLSGLLPNPKLETSVLSICLTISTLHFTISYGVGVATSTRVSNELGAGKPEAARLAVWAAIFIATTEAATVSTILFLCRSFVGYAYSNEKQLVNYIAVMTPLICLSVFMDSLQAVLSGVARGSGWQHIGAYINLGAFYVAGLPMGIVLGFVLHLRGKGLWIGIVIGSAVQSTLLFFVTIFTNWKKQAIKARERAFLKTSSSAGQ
ncbi:protein DETOXIFICATION 6-like isoform X2 [Humulus lupulus]|uniref:protein DETOXIFICATION 6-like isoform X2 n=1 Tax=Humulus lupulus TaxID=3486 RepID=UPI002B40AC1E|nr:protein DETOXIFICATION 6-like isoform X2 [Humulus lupulus]